MQAFDRDLGAIENAYRRAGVLKKTLFVITADHGMAPVTHFVPSTVLTNAVAKAGTSAPSIAYNQSAYVWLKDFAKAPLVAQNIMRGPHRGVKAVYYLTYVGHQQRYVLAGGAHLGPGVEAANQYLLSTLFNGHQPTLVAFCRTDATFSSASTHWKADHGGATWESQHIPLVFSGPGIRRGVVSSAPAQLEDVAPTILTVMGATPRGMQGHVLTDALKRSSVAAKTARSAEVTFLQPRLQALVSEDARERARPTR
jgi:arylsulfatase A-like enzyme